MWAYLKKTIHKVVRNDLHEFCQPVLAGMRIRPMLTMQVVNSITLRSYAPKHVMEVSPSEVKLTPSIAAEEWYVIQFTSYSIISPLLR
jgi:hypothetical protein